MRTAESDRIFTVEEYIKYELTSETRHEFINGQLFEIAGEKDINNLIAGIIYILLTNSLKNYIVFNHDVKVAIPDGSKYYYPDVFVTREEKNETNRYIKYRPEIIVEVVSESTHVTDYVDKYIDYTKIPSLQYYMIVEPETILITVYERTESNEWMAHKYTQLKDIVRLDKMYVSFSLQDVYK
ncbi:MAG TPA: Uma2 family endonuclease [Chitinophagaceae bacterium]